jgi:lysophospholipase L1-like esterase
MVGDSITAGAGTSASWRDSYARRALNRVCGASCDAANSATVGHSGQCLVVTFCGYGPPLTSTWQTEVLDATPKPTTVVLEIGRNDLAHAADTDMQNAYTSLVSSAAVRGIRVIVGTIPPAAAGYQWWNWTEAQRVRVNAWIRATFAYVADFEAVLLAPGSSAMWAGYDSGDHIHPNDLGAVRMGDMVNTGQMQGALP